MNEAEDTIMGVMRRYLAGQILVSQFFTKRDNELIIPMIAEVNIYDDKIIFIKKKYFIAHLA